jgi:hypothetical protein
LDATVIALVGAELTAHAETGAKAVVAHDGGLLLVPESSFIRTLTWKQNFAVDPSNFKEHLAKVDLHGSYSYVRNVSAYATIVRLGFPAHGC